MDLNVFVQQVQQLIQQVDLKANAAHKGLRDMASVVQQARGDVQAVQQAHGEMGQQLGQLMGMMQGMKVGSGSGKSGPSPNQIGRPDMLAIDEIPGRRVPWDLTMQIAVPDQATGPLTATYPLSMDGPFVAVARYATFISSYTFQVSQESGSPRYTGRTWGRQRPISSVLDLMDAMGWADGLGIETDGDCAEGGPPMTAVASRPVSRSPGRSMVFDGYVQIKNSTYPRQNQQVPTSLWAPGWDQMVQLPVLDYWEKGDSIEVELEPMHVNNPMAGNIQALLGSMPFLGGQFDGQEGIMYPSWQCTPGQSDTIQRRPSGVFVLGFLGFKILQPPGVRLR